MIICNITNNKYNLINILNGFKKNLELYKSKREILKNLELQKSTVEILK